MSFSDGATTKKFSMHALTFFSKSFREMAYKSKLSFKILSMIAVNKVEMSPSLASLLF
jgi:hypothetical protein